MKNLAILALCLATSLATAGEPQNTSPVKQSTATKPVKPVTTTVVRNPITGEIQSREQTRTYQDGSTRTVVRAPVSGEIKSVSTTR